MVHSHFQERDYHRCGVEQLQRQGILFEVWQIFLGPLFRKYGRDYQPPDLCQYVDKKLFTDTRAVCDAISGLNCRQPTVAIHFLPDDLFYLPVLRALSRAGICHGTNLTSPPEIAPALRQRERWRTAIRKLAGSPRQWADRVYRRLPLSWCGLSPASFILLNGGEILLKPKSRLASEQTDLIWAHALDYDIYLDHRHRANARGTHVVFLDQYLPFHPDAISEGWVMTTPEAYFPKLMPLFQAVERATGLPVVIAAHPRSDYSGHRDYFQGRKVIRGESARLIAEADFVIAHYSVANNFSVLFRKPVLFVTSADLQRHVQVGPLIREFAGLLGSPLLDIDREWTLPDLAHLKVDESRYSAFQRRYIKRAETPERNTWDIFGAYLRTRFNLNAAVDGPLEENSLS